MSIHAMNAVREMDIRPCGRKFVAMALADYADEGGSCYPSVAKLAAYTSQGEKTVRDHLNALEKDGFLTRERSRNNSGQLGQYRYKINQRRNSPVAEFASGEKRPQPAAKSAGHIHQYSNLTVREPSVSVRSPRPEDAVSVWNEVCVPVGLPQPRSKIPKRRFSALKARLNAEGIDVWREACVRVAGSAFCRGETSRGGWKADIDFLASESGFTKVLEGKYDQSTNVGGNSAADNTQRHRSAFHRALSPDGRGAGDDSGGEDDGCIEAPRVAVAR